MSQKLINTRIGLKYDTLAHWESVWNTFTPLSGEVVFFEIPVANPNPKEGSVEPQEPAILFKVGNGTDTLHDLPWGQAIAADVYSWAKEQSLLGGQYDSGTGWDFTHATTIQHTTQNEVGGFIGKLVQIRVTPVTGQDNTYVIEVSTDGGTNWTPSGTITMTTETYVGDNQTIEIENNIVSAIPAQLSYESGSGLDIENENGVLTGSDVQPILDAVKDMAEVSVVKLTTPETGYASSYVVMQGGQPAGPTINIPKDFVVKSATVETCSTADVPVQGLVPGDKYIDLVINTVDQSATDTHLYIPVKDLVDPYTGGDTTYISVGIDANNEITATLNSNMIADTIDSGSGVDELVTVGAVVDYVQDQISSATPNIEAGNGIDITDGNNTKTVSVKLDDGHNESGHQNNAGSGLVATEDGLAIDDSLIFVLYSGGAGENELS